MKRQASLRTWHCLALLAAIGSIATGPAAGQSRSATLYAFEEAVTGNDEISLRWPTAVAAGGVDEIAVADAAGPSLVIFRDQGSADGWVVHASLELPAPAYSLSCGVDRYLLSTRRPGVLLAVEKSDYTLRELALPGGITPGAVTCLADGQLLVHDLAAGRLVVLDKAMKIRAAIAIAETISGLAAGSGGSFYATLPAVGEVRRYGANGEVLSAVSLPGVGPVPAWPEGLIVEPGGETVVVDRHGARILVMDAGGRWAGSGSRKGWEPGLLRFPADLARLPDGRIVVADHGNSRIQLFRRLEE